MTTATTDADRRPRPWLLYLLGVSLLLHVIGFIALRPYLQTEMWFNVAQEEQRTIEVEQRELRRQERERERRQEIPLSEEQAEALQREVEMKHKRELAERVRELMEVREDLEEARQQTFEQLARREAQKQEKTTFEDLDKQVTDLGKEVDDVKQADEDKTEDNERLSESMQRVTDKHEAAREPADPPTEPLDPADPPEASQTAEALEELSNEAEQLAQTLEQEAAAEPADNTDRKRTAQAKQAQRRAEQVAETSRTLSEAVAQQKASIVEQASAPPPVTPVPPLEQLAAAPPDQLYDQAVEIEQQIDDAHDDIRAAELAMNQDSSFADAKEALNTWRPQRPDYGEQLRQAVPTQTVGELNELRQTMDGAVNEAQSMALRGRNKLNQAQGLVQQNAGAQRFAQQAMLRAAVSQRSASGVVVDLTGVLGLGIGSGGGAGDSSEMQADLSGEGSEMAAGIADGQKLNLSKDKIMATAMPGRMFTDESERAGWLYIDTWYVIGPWENNSNVDFKTVHPPEVEIDFDAEYHDGKFADDPDHPYNTLRWEFVQADHIRVEPPKVYGAATYYAYTEVYFDEDRDMLISIASDDAAKMWLNGQEIWADYGQSSWNLGEGFRRVPFRQGFNTLLVRIENGPVHCIWSVLLCPPEVMNQ